MSPLEVLAELEGRCRRGDLTPVPVVLGPLPDRAGRVMRAIAADIEWLIGVRLAADLPLELPYAVSMAVNRGLAKDSSTASKALRNLVDLGVLRFAGSMPPQRPLLPGTKLYAPPERDEDVLGPEEVDPLTPPPPPPPPPDVLGSEEAAVEIVVLDYDATEITGGEAGA